MGRRMEYVRNVLSEKIDLHTDSHTTSCTWKHDLVAKHRFHLAHSADHMLTHSYSSCVKVFSRSVYPMCTDLQGSSTHTHTHALAHSHIHTPSCSTGQDVSQVATCTSRICLRALSLVLSACVLECKNVNC